MSPVYGSTEFLTELKKVRQIADEIMRLEAEIAKLGEEVSRLQANFEDQLRKTELIPPQIDTPGGGHYLREHEAGP